MDIYSRSCGFCQDGVIVGNTACSACGGLDTGLTPEAYLATMTSEEAVLYYPGAHSDWGPLRLFAEYGGHKTFIYADYGIGSVEARRFLNRIPQWTLSRLDELPPGNLGLTSWGETWAVECRLDNRDHGFGWDAELLCRLKNHKDKKIRVIYLGTEAIGTYPVLIRAGLRPNTVVLQDHGLGGNWARFGGRSPLYQAARRSTMPEFVFAGPTARWPGYKRVSADKIFKGQMHDFPRAVYHRRIL